jgi:hypothetical protein
MLPISLRIDLSAVDKTRPASWTVTGWQIEPDQWDDARVAFGPGLEPGIADDWSRVIVILTMGDRMGSRSVELRRHERGGGWSATPEDRRYIGEWLAAEVPTGNPLRLVRTTYVVLP